MLSIKAYIGNNQQKSEQKKLTLVEIEPGTSGTFKILI